MDLLPTDLLPTILTKLPSKSILICKCVCKKWHSLLSHPNFTRNYARNSQISSLLLFRPRFDANWSSLLEFDADGGFNWTHLIPKIPNCKQIPNFRPVPNFLQFRRRSESENIVIIGSCNGLLFFRQTWWIPIRNRVVDKLYCCNPLFGGCVEIAEEERQRGAGRLWSVRYTIGYISSTDTIKLLRFVRNVSENGEEVRQSDILTVGIDRTWRIVDEGSLDWYWDGIYSKVREASFNGAHHWIEQSKRLCTFDFGEEKTGPESMLPELLQQQEMLMELAVLNNRISAVISNVNNVIDIWTMEEYGDAESWCLTRTIMLGGFHLPLPVCLVATFANGGILINDCRGHPLVYVTNNGEIKVYEFGTDTGVLYPAEYAPRFYPLDHVWGAAELAPRFYPLDRSWDVGNTRSLDKKVWSSMLCFFRTAFRKFSPA